MTQPPSHTDELTPSRKSMLQDYEGIYKFKFIIPSIYILSWFAMIFGPVLFPALYRYLIFITFSYMVIKSASFVLVDLWVLVQNTKILNRVQNPEKKYNPLGQVNGEEIYHAFIIPNYKEDPETIIETLNVLKKHKRSQSNYLVFLAMEQHEKDSNIKAEKIIRKFSTSAFRFISYTQHKVRQFEQKGKASNVSWCVEHLQPHLESQMIPIENVFLTIIDVDSWVPDAYIDEIENKINSSYEERHNMYFAPSQIFTRNHLEVPMISRVYDQIHGSGHISSSFTCFGVSMPISNYSVSLKTIQNIGYWDTIEEAIGEDMHTYMKAIWKTQGKIEGIPVFTPFNQLNLATGGSIVQDFKARFWQAERHARGIVEVAYLINMTIKNGLNLKKTVMILHVFELFFLTCIPPWMLISFQLQNFGIYGEEILEVGISQQYIMRALTLTAIIPSLMFPILEVFKKRSSQILWGIDSGSYWRIFEMVLLYPPLLFIFTVPPFVIAAFSDLCGKREYVVAVKKSDTKIAIDQVEEEETESGMNTEVEPKENNNHQEVETDIDIDMETQEMLPNSAHIQAPRAQLQEITV